MIDNLNVLASRSKIVSPFGELIVLGFIVKKPLLQILQKMGLQPNEIDRDETKRSLEEFARTSGIMITSAQLIKEIPSSLFTPVALFRSVRDVMVNFVGAYDLGFSMIIESLSGITRTLRAPINTYIWVVIPKSPEGEEKTMQILKSIRDRVGDLPITPKNGRLSSQ